MPPRLAAERNRLAAAAGAAVGGDGLTAVNPLAEPVGGCGELLVRQARLQSGSIAASTVVPAWTSSNDRHLTVRWQRHGSGSSPVRDRFASVANDP